ncbi:MAG: esterase-like activity of phytase family protein [Thermoleophilia bacterium]
MRFRLPRALAGLASVAVTAGIAAAAATAGAAEPPAPAATLDGRAVLPARTFAAGPPSGSLLGADPINGIAPPFSRQPVQGFSGVLDNGDGTFLALADNGYGSLENSADFELRAYRIASRFATAAGGAGTIRVLGAIRLRDPRRQIDFPIVNEFTRSRILTGADLDVESIQRADDGTLWFGDEFGPFLIHTSATGVVLEPPVPLPDADDPEREIRSPQSPYSEESATVRALNAVRAHARAHGNDHEIVASPAATLLNDGDPETGEEFRIAPPEGSGLEPASSDIIDVTSLHAAGFPVVPYTVNDTETIEKLLKLGVDGIISDRPDLVHDAVAAFDADGDGTPGDLLDEDGLVDPEKFDVQGHRGSRNLRPENTLPAFEAGLDELVTTLETDAGLTKDGELVLFHDPYVEAAKCRRADGSAYESEDDVLIRDLTREEIQSRFVCDKVFRGEPQSNDRSLSPVAVAFAKEAGLDDPYAVPTLQNLFDFVGFYARWYREGPGASEPGADAKAANAERVRFNIESKINPRTDRDPLGNVYSRRTADPGAFARALGEAIEDNGLAERADVQSFDWRSLLAVQKLYPAIRTVYLIGDYPVFDDPSIAGSDDGTNLQPQGRTGNSPWLAGIRWPYRQTARSTPFRAQRSGGFEGMAISPDRRTLYPLLELPLTGDDGKVLRISAFDIASGEYTGDRYDYRLDDRGTNIGDFVLYSPTQGLVLERDGSEGDLSGYKAVQKVTLGEPGEEVGKTTLVDLQDIADPAGISTRGAREGDVGLGATFSFPFTTIEDVVVLGPDRIGVINDNNFPFSVGRHVGERAPDDTEFIVLRLPEELTLGED